MRNKKQYLNVSWREQYEVVCDQINLNTTQAGTNNNNDCAPQTYNYIFDCSTVRRLHWRPFFLNRDIRFPYSAGCWRGFGLTSDILGLTSYK